jgi:hypothetical protein
VSQSEKSALFQALKGAGVEFTKHYREYKTDDLQAKYDELVAAGVITNGAPPPEQEQPFVPTAGEEPADPDAAAFFGYSTPDAPAPVPTSAENHDFGVQSAPAPRTERDPNEFAGQRLNSKPLEEPIRTDAQGRVWLQEEVMKPATPRPRGRRVLQYTDTGTTTQTITLEDGTVESFEVAGNQVRTAEVKITLPSYQVGIFRDPRFPFKVYTYGGKNGFDYFEVHEFYGGVELVPAEIKKTYVSNVLCYDIRTTVRAIEAEARQLALQGRIQL